MELTTSQIQFIKDHATDDLTRLLLSAAKYPGMDIPFLVDQIAVRRQIREKLPSWFENGQLVFPAKIAAEQCSSEQTAAYKQELIGESWTICDLTGGLGIDSYFLSRKAKHLTYIERFPVYCEAAKHNFSVLEANNITIINADAAQVVDTLPEVDAFYIDPARRGESNKRVFALQDCEPNLPGLLPALLKRSPRVIAKLSPMADITQKGLKPNVDFTQEDIESNDNGKLSNNTYIANIINKYKNKFGKSRVVVIKSQLGQPITAYSGDEVYWTVPKKLPKMTKLMIDGKALYIHRANYQIIDTSLLN